MYVKVGGVGRWTGEPRGLESQTWDWDAALPRSVEVAVFTEAERDEALLGGFGEAPIGPVLVGWERLCEGKSGLCCGCGELCGELLNEVLCQGACWELNQELGCVFH